METRIRTSAGLAGLAVAFGMACGSSSEENPFPDRASDLPAGAVVIDVEALIETSNGGIEERRRVVARDEDEWRAIWSEATSNFSPAPELPTVDFATRMVVVAAMGRRGTGGYSIEIDEVRRAGERLYVSVVETSPGPDCFTTQALTAPLVAVGVPRASDVIFVESEGTRTCE